MKTVTLALSLFFVSIISMAQETKGVNIKVTIDNINSNEGKVVAGLHTQETFMAGPGIQNLESTIENGKVVLTFTNVAPGSYAILTLHDENSNNRMDYQSNGMPAESYGMSGNDMSIGPPNFGSAKFEVGNEDLELNIRF
ncbi:DUF2141 domain-containing protein [Allomuricauda sp. NBRC 101325]|uniref:DUF2141 domain-containing protein n=1 Tax=Allomuricauda sp. NBRC 101325 TaxID=1113758 RepID=UPI0024A55CC7|nr:DUF2141 domain-containing protein [Muricauda sp. NBRC 101325]GLU44309.1 hypothetical protein Musp01_19330 [Muricauda sp. NBRC 101325]